MNAGLPLHPKVILLCELPLTDTHHIFLSIIFSCKIFLIEKIQLCEGTAKMSTLFKNLSNIYIEQFLEFPWLCQLIPSGD